MNNDNNDQPMLTEKEFCLRVNISRVTAWRLRASGKLAFFRIGSRVRYSPQHVAEFLGACERRARRPKRWAS